jgi:hypothetical protein
MAKKNKPQAEAPVEAEVAETAPTEGVEVLDDKGEKAPRVVTRYGVEYDGNEYTSPRKALDAAGLTAVKGSRLRARFKKAGNVVGTEVEYEGKKFKYIEVPASAEVDNDETDEPEETNED